MIITALILALLLEQVRPLYYAHPVNQTIKSYLGWITRSVQSDEKYINKLIWLLAVILPAMVSWMVYLVLNHWGGWFFGLSWTVAVLYVCLGFRELTFHLDRIKEELIAGNESAALQSFHQWGEGNSLKASITELPQQVLAYGVLFAHRRVFGIIAWFCFGVALGLGPAGILIYRMNDLVRVQWSRESLVAGNNIRDGLVDLVERTWHIIDWVPARLTACCFAVVGNFEGAMSGWRGKDSEIELTNDRVVLAATSGAVNLVITNEPGMPGSITEGSGMNDVNTIPQHTQIVLVAGLIWRTLVLCLLVVGAFSIFLLF